MSSRLLRALQHLTLSIKCIFGCNAEILSRHVAICCCNSKLFTLPVLLFVCCFISMVSSVASISACPLKHQHSSIGFQCKPLCHAASTTICVVNPFNLMQVPMSRSLLAASPYTVSTSAWISPPYADLTYPEVQDLIQAAYSNTTNAAGLAVQQLTGVSKQGVAGNGLCENGEMPSSVGNFTGEPLHFSTTICGLKDHMQVSCL